MRKILAILEQKDQPPPPPPPPPLPQQLGPWDTGYIAFDGGIPVGGSSQLTLFQNGSYVFAGHFRDSGVPSYNDTLHWAVQSSSGVVYTFSHSGHMAGTIESGSRDDDWNVPGASPPLAGGWADLCAGRSWKWTAAVNWDVNAAFDSLMKAIAAVQQIAQVVRVVF